MATDNGKGDGKDEGKGTGARRRSSSRSSSKPPADSLPAALLIAQGEAETVEKAGRNKDQGYAYATAADVIEEAQRALHVAGLVGYIIPDLEPSVQAVSSKSGTAGLFVTVHAELVIVHPPTNAELKVPAIGTGVDYPGDKAIYKAMTGAAKYAYAATLGIPFGDDPEDSESASPEARDTARRGSAEASPAQKRAVTTNLKKAGLAPEVQRELVHAIAGDPPRKSAVSSLLDVLIPASKASDEALRTAVDDLLKRHNVSPATIPPGDTEGLEGAGEEPDSTEAQEQAELGDETPPADEPSGGEVFDPASGMFEPAGDGEGS